MHALGQMDRKHPRSWEEQLQSASSPLSCPHAGAWFPAPQLHMLTFSPVSCAHRPQRVRSE